jgi:hypothetical protein
MLFILAIKGFHMEYSLCGVRALITQSPRNALTLSPMVNAPRRLEKIGAGFDFPCLTRGVIPLNIVAVHP